MMIWEEYRLHAIIFSVRCLTVFLMATLRPFDPALGWNPNMEYVALWGVILVHHRLADAVTAVYGDKDGRTTVRQGDNHSPNIQLVLRFYAFYQVPTVLLIKILNFFVCWTPNFY